MPDMLFKVLSADGRSCHGGNLQWPLPTQRPDGTWAPGEAVTVTGKIVPCENGIHLATARQVVESWQGARVYVAQWGREIVAAGNKYVVRSCRLLHPTAWNERLARHFAADCAERALQRATQTDPRSWAAIRAARLFADAKIDGAALGVTRKAATAAAAAYAADAADAAYAAYGGAAAAAAAAAADAAYGAAYGAGAAAYAADAAYAAAYGAAAAAYAAADAAYAAAADAADAGNARNAERDWQTERFLYYLKGGQPPCSDGS